MYFETQLLGWPFALLGGQVDWMTEPEGYAGHERPTTDDYHSEPRDASMRRATQMEEISR